VPSWFTPVTIAICQYVGSYPAPPKNAIHQTCGVLSENACVLASLLFPQGVELIPTHRLA